MRVSDVGKLRFTVVTLTLLLASGCAGTTVQTVALKQPELPDIIARIQVQSVSMEADAIREHAVGIRFSNYGFTEMDLANLRESLERTIESATGSKELHSARQVRILLTVREYVVAYTNHSLAMFAALDWCAKREDGSAIYSEVFYASRSWNILGPTPGGEKDAITRAVVRRVVESSLILAAGGGPGEALPRVTKGTHDTSEEAVATLPENMRSWGLLFFVGPVPMFIPGSRASSIPWQSVDASTPVSCDATMENG